MGVVTRWYRQCRMAWHKPRHWAMRPETIDGRVFRNVVIENEYQLPRSFDAEDVIVDVGAHIGSFSYSAMCRGAGAVYCYEPSVENYQLLTHNLKPFAGRAHPNQAAVWRSDTDQPCLSFTNNDRRNTGCGRMEPATHQDATAVIKFDDLIKEITDRHERHVRLLKLDCEGAEWPILLTAHTLDRVESICGEYHLVELPSIFNVAGFQEFSTDVLEDVLNQAGFWVDIQPSERNPGYGLFFANNRHLAA